MAIDLSARVAGKHYAVLGLGKSGLSAARELKRAGATLCVWDDHPKAQEEAQSLGYPLRAPEDMPWDKLEAMVISPGIPHSFPTAHPAALLAKQAKVPLICDVELLVLTQSQARFVGITGTNGKSTTTALIGHMLAQAGCKVAVGGNLGIPALDLEPLGADGIYVLELSSYQLELLDQARMDVAVLLNITPDHLARHGGMSGYVAAKERIFRVGRRPLQAILGRDEAETQALREKLNADPQPERRLWTLSAQEDQDSTFVFRAGQVSSKIDGNAVSIDLTDCPTLRGQHNAQNAAAALAVGQALGLSGQDCQTGIASYPGLAHRQELVASPKGILYVNDSKATNAEAAERALQSYVSQDQPQPVFWIAGGVAKEGGIDTLSAYFADLSGIFLIGAAAPAFCETIKAATDQPEPKCYDSLDLAVQAAHDAALATMGQDGGQDGKGAKPVVLFAPACASFDQYANFEKRGDHFKSLVQALR